MDVTPTPVTTSKPVSRRGGGFMNLILIGAAAIAIGGVAFAIGRSTAPADPLAGRLPGGVVSIEPGTSFDPGSAGGGPGTGRPGGALFAGGGPTISGTVASIDGDEITLTLESGETLTLDVDDRTTYRTASEATAADVAVGDRVDVRVAADGLFRGGDDAAAAFDLTASDVTVER